MEIEGVFANLRPSDMAQTKAYGTLFKLIHCTSNSLAAVLPQVAQKNIHVFNTLHLYKGPV